MLVHVVIDVKLFIVISHMCSPQSVYFSSVLACQAMFILVIVIPVRGVRVLIVLSIQFVMECGSY